MRSGKLTTLQKLPTLIYKTHIAKFFNKMKTKLSSIRMFTVLIAIVLVAIVVSSCSKAFIALGDCKGTTSGSLSGIGGGTIIYVPNAFTPNGDGLNDVFKSVCQNVSNYNLTIKDAFGFTLFTTTNPDDGWDGKNKSGATVQDYYNCSISLKDGNGNNFSYTLTITSYQYQDGCLTKNCSHCRFGDQIDPKLGFIYPTQEKICQ